MVFMLTNSLIIVLNTGAKVNVWSVRLWTHISRNNHAAKLIDDENVQLRGRLAELLLEDLQDVLHDFGRVSKSYSDVTQWPDGVIRDQMGIPTSNRFGLRSFLLSQKNS